MRRCFTGSIQMVMLLAPLVSLLLAPISNPPTFAAQVAPIIYRSCTPCHRAGEVAPFALETYPQAKRFASMIKLTTSRRFMPPWKAIAGHGDFVGERTLSPTEIKTIGDWVDSGAPSGDLAKAPKPPKFADGWQLGTPDLIVEVPTSFQIPADGPDILQNFVIPTSLTSDQVVGAIELRPGNPKVVHHALVFMDSNGAARRLDEKTKEPGYQSFGGPGFFPTGSLGGWAPGGTPVWLPDGVGRYFQKGSDIVLQLHYHPTGKAEADRSKIGIYFSRKPVTRLVGGIALENWEIKIPAGDKKYRRESSYVLPKEATFLSVTPHMHLLGREMRADATLPDGKKIPLVWIKEWDFRWQDTFVFKSPIRLPKGTRLQMYSVHNNSEEMSTNPFNPPREVVYGEGSNDEMSLCIFEVTTDLIPDLLELIADDSRHRKVLERAIELTKKGGG